MKTESQTVENFGRNVRFTPRQHFLPESESEVLEILAIHPGQQIRVVGSRHAWSDAICSDQVLIDVRHLNKISINPQQNRVRVGAGCQVKQLLATLSSQGLTLPSIGLIDEQTVAGATATGTHGSGKNSLSHYITAVRVAHYDGQTGNPCITTIDGGRELLAARCSLGLLGVIVELELECRPAYNVQEHSRRYKSLDDVLAAESDYPLQQFYLMPWSWHWFGHHRVETGARKSRLASLYHFYWYLFIDWGLHLLLFFLVKLLRLRWPIRFFYKRLIPLAIVRNWRVTDDAASMLVMEHELFRHIEIELFVPGSRLAETLAYVQDAVAVFGGQSPPAGSGDPIPDQYQGIYCHHYPICVRRILADDTLISMASPWTDGSHQDCYAISLISYQWPGERDGFFQFADFIAEQTRERFTARVHWGKYNPFSRQQNEAAYPQLDEFREIAEHFDPHGVFCNGWLRETVRQKP